MLHPEYIPDEFALTHKSYEENADAWLVDGESMRVFMGKSILSLDFTAFSS